MGTRGGSGHAALPCISARIVSVPLAGVDQIEAGGSGARRRHRTAPERALRRSEGTAKRPDLLPWRHVIVDEYQDVNPAQAAFVHALTTPKRPGARGARGATLIGVGDDWQAIFGFQGGNASLIRTTADPAGVVRHPVLTQSGGQIVDLDGHPNRNADEMLAAYITHPDSAVEPSEAGKPGGRDHPGFYRDPIRTTDGSSLTNAPRILRAPRLPRPSSPRGTRCRRSPRSRNSPRAEHAPATFRLSTAALQPRPGHAVRTVVLAPLRRLRRAHRNKWRTLPPPV